MTDQRNGFIVSLSALLALCFSTALSHAQVQGVDTGNRTPTNNPRMGVIESQRPVSQPLFYTVVGAVERSGVYESSKQSLPVKELMEACGGLAPEADSTLRVIRNYSSRFQIFFDPSKPDQNEQLQAGDIVIVIRKSGSSAPATIPIVGLGLSDRPVVFPLSPSIQTISDFNSALRQHPSLVSQIQIVSPTPEVAGRLSVGSIVFFPPHMVDRAPLTSPGFLPASMALAPMAKPAVSQSAPVSRGMTAQVTANSNVLITDRDAVSQEIIVQPAPQQASTDVKPQIVAQKQTPVVEKTEDDLTLPMIVSGSAASDSNPPAQSDVSVTVNPGAKTQQSSTNETQPASPTTESGSQMPTAKVVPPLYPHSAKERLAGNAIRSNSDLPQAAQMASAGSGDRANHNGAINAAPRLSNNQQSAQSFDNGFSTSSRFAETGFQNSGFNSSKMNGVSNSDLQMDQFGNAVITTSHQELGSGGSGFSTVMGSLAASPSLDLASKTVEGSQKSSSETNMLRTIGKIFGTLLLISAAVVLIKVITTWRRYSVEQQEMLESASAASEVSNVQTVTNSETVVKSRNDEKTNELIAERFREWQDSNSSGQNSKLLNGIDVQRQGAAASTVSSKGASFEKLLSNAKSSQSDELQTLASNIQANRSVEAPREEIPSGLVERTRVEVSALQPTEQDTATSVAAASIEKAVPQTVVAATSQVTTKKTSIHEAAGNVVSESTAGATSLSTSASASGVASAKPRSVE